MSSPAADRAAALKRLVAPGVLVLAALAVWLTYPDKTFVFDGAMFAQIVDRSAEGWRRDMLNPRHLLFNLFFQILRDGLGHLGVTVDAYRLFQEINALAGAAGLLLFGDLARRLSRDAGLGWCAALLLGATLCYGTRATEGQVYMLMSLGAIAFLWSAVRLIEEPTAGRAVLTVGTAMLAALFHAADASLFPAAAAALWLAFPRRRGAALVAAAAGPLLLTSLYVIILNGVGFPEFIGNATDFRAHAGAGFWPDLLGMFWSGGGMTPWTRLLEVCRETGAAMTPSAGGAALAGGLALWIGTGFAIRRAWPRLDAPRRKEAVVLAAAWAGFSVVSAFWLGGLFFYVPALACAAGMLALAAGPSWPDLTSGARRRILGVSTLIGVAFAIWNLRAGIIPQSRIENNPGYRQAMFVGAHTEPASWIIVSGLGSSNSKVYLAMFAHRRRQVLEYFFDRNPKDAALRKLAEFFDVAAVHGVPMYLLSDLVESPGAAPIFKERFGVTMREIQKAFGAGRIIGVASGPDERVYLYAPQAHQSELFAVLGYSVLTDKDDTRWAESMMILKEIARGMSPSERRRAGELLRTTNWGFDLVWEDLSRLMSAESWAASKTGAQRRFDDYRRSADFWLRAGNLYGLLGLKAETLDAWTRAEKLSGDASLLKRIEELRRSK